MAEILSQSEIDELLLALAQGKEPEQKESEEEVIQENVRLYDFRTANKFSREQIRMLSFIHENYVSRLSTYLSGALRVACEAAVVSVEELLFGEFSNSLPSPTFLAIYNMPPMVGNSMMEVSSPICYEIISRLFGGKGQVEPETGKPFTEIETAVLVRMVQQILTAMDESWVRVAPMRASLDRIETSAQFAQILAAGEPVVIITMSITIGELSDMINLCIPHVAVQPIAKQLAAANWYDDRGGGGGNETDLDPDHLNPQLGNTLLTMHAVFDPTQATVQEVIGLQVGDVIRLNHPLNRELTLLVEHLPKFKGKLGKKNHRIAFMTTEILLEETEDG